MTKVARPRLHQWSAPAAVFAAALAVYLSTAPPGLTWANHSADGGDLITAALVHGVAHPPGYPTYTLLARLFLHWPWAEPAWRITLLSAASAALAAAFVAATVQELAVDRKQAALPALTAGLLLAFAPLLWGQAIVVEVYALHAAFSAALIWTLARGQRSGNPRWFALSGLLFGLALGNHLTIIWLLPLLLTNYEFTQQATRNAQTELRLTNYALRTLHSAFCILPGLLVYLSIPLAAARIPPVSWGDARTWEDFWWLVTARLYSAYPFATGWPAALERSATWAGLLWRDFQPWGLALALAGLRHMNRRFRLAALVSLALTTIWAIGYNTVDSHLNLLAVWVFVAIWAGLGLVQASDWLARQGSKGRIAAAALCLLLVVWPLARNWQAIDLSNDREAEDAIAALLDAAPPNALIVLDGDRATFSLWYARYGLKQRPDLSLLNAALWPLDSYRTVVSHAHPQLTGPAPPPELADLLAQTLAKRPVLFASLESAEPDATALHLDPARYQLEPVAPLAGLWRLRPIE